MKADPLTLTTGAAFAVTVLAALAALLARYRRYDVIATAGLVLAFASFVATVLLGLLQLLATDEDRSITPRLPTPPPAGSSPLSSSPMAFPSSTISHPLAPIRFNPIDDTVPRCLAISGKGDVPTGQALWIVVKTKEANRTKYYFDDVRTMPGSWSAPNVIIGSNDLAADPVGEVFEIQAVLFNSEDDQSIASGRYSAGTELLPSSASTQARALVHLGTDRRPCAGN